MLANAIRLRALTMSVLVVFAAIAGCGGSTSTVRCTSTGLRGPATTSSGLVAIALNQSNYAPDDDIW